MSNGTIGSPANPDFAGWIEHGAGWQFACRLQSVNFDVYLVQIHVYFDTYQGNGAIGKMCLWNDGGGYTIWREIDQGIINNGTLTWGGQQWWSQPISPPLFCPAGKLFWIGCWCNQNIVASTYDTNPQTFAMNSGSTSGPTAFSGAANSGQGPLGAYVEYSTVVYGTTSDMGAAGGGIYIPRASSILTASSPTKVGMNDTGGLIPVNSLVSSPFTAFMGSNGGGLAPVATSIAASKVKIWRPQYNVRSVDNGAI